MPSQITVIGSSNTDMVLNLTHIPQPGETVTGGKFSQAHGGKGANQAVAAARAGGHVTFFTCVGNDSFGHQALEHYRKEGIETRYIKIENESASGIAFIFVDANAENSIGVASGANFKLAPDDIYKNKEIITQADIILLQLEIPLETVQAAVDIAFSEKIPVILNPAPYQKLPDSLLQKITYLTPNHIEAAQLTDLDIHDSPKNMLKALKDKGVANSIITHGANGAWVEINKEIIKIPAYKVKAIDTTAAGDVFNGALAVALVKDKNLLSSIRFANAAAALSVTKAGAQPSAPYYTDIEKFITEQSANNTEL